MAVYRWDISCKGFWFVDGYELPVMWNCSTSGGVKFMFILTTACVSLASIKTKLYLFSLSCTV